MFNLQETMVSVTRLCHPFHRTRTHYHWTRKHRRRWHRPPPTSHCNSHPPPLRLSPKFIRLQLPSRKWLLSSLYIRRPCHRSWKPSPIGYTFPSRPSRNKLRIDATIKFSKIDSLFLSAIVSHNTYVIPKNNVQAIAAVLLAKKTFSPRVWNFLFSKFKRNFLNFLNLVPSLVPSFVPVHAIYRSPRRLIPLNREFNPLSSLPPSSVKIPSYDSNSYEQVLIKPAPNNFLTTSGVNGARGRTIFGKIR